MGNTKKVNYTLKTAIEEASRCLLCYDAPCTKSCPAGTNPEKFIRSLRFKNVKGAIETIRSANILGGTCALVCEYDKLCEEACSRCGIDRAIDIGGLQNFLTEQEKSLQMKVLKKKNETDIKVACIGAGPASLACSAVLAVEGITVDVFDKNKKPGGLLTYAICSSRLPQEVVDFDISHLESLGVRFETNKCFQKDFTIRDLQEAGFEAIFIGTGLWKAKKLNIRGLDSENVYDALSFLYQIKNQQIKSLKGKKLIVIGGGDVAMDCALSAKNLGAEDVSIVYRRTMAESPACLEQKKEIQLEGVNFISNFIPEEILVNEKKAEYVIFKGRDGLSQLKIKADLVVYAVGQTIDENYISDLEELKTMENDGIFVGGDLVNGGKSVVQAVADGKELADKILKLLSERGRL